MIESNPTAFTCPSGDGSLRHPCPDHPFVPAITNEQAIKLARAAAYSHCNQHSYLPQTWEAAATWQPHEWVVSAIVVAADTAAPADTWFADQLTAMGEVIPFATTPSTRGIDPTDPWRGLYAPELMPKLDGVKGWHAVHPDLPQWPSPEDEERALDPLVRAQGFAFAVVDGDFEDDDCSPGEFDHCAWLADWKPEPPTGDHWRLVMVHDTEDGPVAVFVRPLALIDASPKGGSDSTTPVAITRMLPEVPESCERPEIGPHPFTGFDVGPFFVHLDLADNEAMTVSGTDVVGDWVVTHRESGFTVQKGIPTPWRAIWLAQQLLAKSSWIGSTKAAVLAALSTSVVDEIRVLRADTMHGDCQGQIDTRWATSAEVGE